MDTGLQRSRDARDRAREERLRDRERRIGAPDARLLASRWGRALVAAVGLLAALTVAGLAILWPYGGVRHGPSDAMGGATEGAAVTRALTMRCPGPGGQRCLTIDVRLADGAHARTLVGAMALLLSVPLTTALCAAVVHRIPADALGGAHAHHH